MQKPNKKLVIDLKGPDGNIFFIMMKASELLDEDTANEMCNRVVRSGSYEHAKMIVAEYVDVEYID